MLFYHPCDNASVVFVVPLVSVQVQVLRVDGVLVLPVLVSVSHVDVLLGPTWQVFDDVAGVCAWCSMLACCRWCLLVLALLLLMWCLVSLMCSQRMEAINRGRSVRCIEIQISESRYFDVEISIVLYRNADISTLKHRHCDVSKLANTIYYILTLVVIAMCRTILSPTTSARKAWKKLSGK